MLVEKEFLSSDFKCSDLNQLIKFTGSIAIATHFIGRSSAELQKSFKLFFQEGRLIESQNV